MEYRKKIPKTCKLKICLYHSSYLRNGKMDFFIDESLQGKICSIESNHLRA